MTQLGGLLPPAERFDGDGGAIATWVRETYTLSSFSNVVACPRATSEFARGVALAPLRSYGLYENALRAASHVLTRVLRKPFQVVYNRLLGSDTFWIKSSLRSLNNPDLIHLHNRPHYAKRLREFGYRGRIILHMHNDLRDYMTVEQKPHVFPYVDAVAFCSPFMLQRAREAFGEVPGGVAIANGVSRTEILRADSRPHDGVLRLAYAGRIMAEKGPLEAVEVCAELRRRGHDARIDLVGGTGSGADNSATPYLAAITSAVAELNRMAGAEVARMLGPRPHNEVFALFSRSDIFVLPAKWEEPFGMVALESMAKGCVPVITRRGGLPDVVRDGGIVVDTNLDDAAAIVNDFADMIESIEAKLPEIRERGWNRAEELTWENVTAQLDSVVGATLNGGRQ